MRSSIASKTDMEFILRLLTKENALAIETAMQTGLRISDVLRLKSDDLKKTSFTIREEKTGKSKRVRICNKSKEKLTKVAGKVYIFEKQGNGFEHRTRQAVWHDVKRATKCLRLKDNITPHSARKYYAERLLEFYKGDVCKVQKALNHTSPMVTVIYYLADQEALKRFEQQK